MNSRALKVLIISLLLVSTTEASWFFGGGKKTPEQVYEERARTNLSIKAGLFGLSAEQKKLISLEVERIKAEERRMEEEAAFNAEQQRKKEEFEQRALGNKKRLDVEDAAWEEELQAKKAQNLAELHQQANEANIRLTALQRAAMAEKELRDINVFVPAEEYQAQKQYWEKEADIEEQTQRVRQEQSQRPFVKPGLYPWENLSSGSYETINEYLAYEKARNPIVHGGDKKNTGFKRKAASISTSAARSRGESEEVEDEEITKKDEIQEPNQEVDTDNAEKDQSTEHRDKRRRKE